MKIFVIDGDGNSRQPSSLEDVDLAESKLLWVDLYNPADEELSAIGQYFDVHSLVIEDCQKLVDVPKVEEFKEHLFIIWHFLRDHPETEVIEMAGLAALLGANYLVTVHNRELPELEPILSKLSDDPSHFRESPAVLLHAMMDRSVDDFFPLVEDLEDEIEVLLDDLIKDAAGNGMEMLLRLKHRNSAIRKTVMVHGDVIGKLLRPDLPFIPKSSRNYFRDIQDHLVRLGSEVDTNSEYLTTALDVLLGKAGNRMNVTMKRLAAVATVFLPLMFLVGFWGMNFESMPEFAWEYGYILALTSIAVVAIVMVVIAKRNDWF
ncbi:MAG: magnesium/cobalt transporter CorA [Actinobacteria bacterium]|nr:magnesium/cobalt transporter CorA [Actinomycetota bacterium]MBU4302199.1 magnesium/cobalt transporter CorA [Actinomycetota bacterium]MBU4386593.1 magnesium/cobalt transporter CorA [Actinomycetota bacterium]MCG2794520.1 magnesium/cobalt transporter CorA [Actinomycetes bacterium]